MNTYFSKVLESITQNKPIVQITIIEQKGSAPRMAGTMMLLKEDASTFGTIGGGLYEGKALEYAGEILKNKCDNAIILYFDMQAKSNATDMDMICGGELRLLVEYIPPTQKNIELYTALVESELKGLSLNFITRIETLEGIEKNTIYTKEFAKTSKSLISLDKKQESVDIEMVPENVLEALYTYPERELKNYIEGKYEFSFHTLKKPYRIHIFGAGHVSCELAKIAHYLDFKTYILDDRAEFSNAERFPQSETIVLDDMKQDDISRYLSTYNLDEKDGIIIVTRGHARDRDVLMASLKIEAGYLGMIGSRTKREATYNHLLENGYNKSDFDKIHSPIGLSIGAQSPQEIAISISAQLIQWRAGVLAKSTCYA